MANRAYEVTAPTAVLGHEPGSKFEADLNPVQEARLVASGALKIVTGGAQAAPLKPDEAKDVKDAPAAKDTGGTPPPKQLP